MYEAADSKTADTVTKLVTDSDGRIIVNNLLPGDYYFIETDSKGNMPYDKVMINFHHFARRA